MPIIKKKNSEDFLKGECLCGSNRKYDRCCKPYIKMSWKDSEAYRTLENYDEEYCINNALMTSYISKIKANTEFFVEKGIRNHPLLEIDKKAMKEFFDIFISMKAQGLISVDLISKFERIESFFKIKELKEECYKAIGVQGIIFETKRKKVKEILKKLDYKKIEDIELLMIYLELHLKEIEILERIEILKKITTSDIKDIEKLRYYILLIKILKDIDSDDYAKELEKIDEILEDIDINNLSEGLLIEFLKNLVIYQIFSERNVLDYLENKLLINDLEKNIGDDIELKIEYYRSIGEIYYMQHKYDKAIESIKKILELRYDIWAYIDLARYYLENGDLESAFKIMDKLDPSTIPSYNKFDYFLTFGRIFLLKNNPKKAEELYEELENIKSGKMEKDVLSSYLKELLNCYKSFKDNKGNTEETSGILNTLNSIFELKPNFYGIGININAIFDKVIKNLK